MKKICLFGLYNYTYARNSSIRDSLKRAGMQVVEVHREVPNERMELPEDFTLRKSVYRILRKLKLYIELLGEYKKVMKCDIVIVLHPGHLDLPFAWVLCKLGGMKLLFDTSISPYDTMFIGRSIARSTSFKAWAVKWVEGFLLRLPDRLFTDTKGMKDFISSTFNIHKEKVFVLPLGANEKMYKPAANPTQNTKINVLFFGLYNPLHGTQHIMASINKLKVEKGITFTMLGDGYLKESLIDYKKKHNLRNVTFIGFVPEQELVKQIQKADILLGTFSDNPVFQRVVPNKVFAALACKKPLITARMAPVEEFFTHGKDIYFCNPEDPKSLAHAIKTVAFNTKLRKRLAEEGYRAYRDNFTTKEIGRLLVKEITAFHTI
ncbi:glycosyltransferase [Candidatus Roizmanbacteria bacterium]|nr:glycosyltransferase [Candidatus Roizmanbacteria bacterium]